MHDAAEATTAQVPPVGLIDAGGYQIVERIGAGGMAEVFRAVASGPGGFEIAVAIKRLRRSFCGNEKLTAMFLNEARVVARLSHPNIVAVHGMAITDGQPFMVMELVDGIRLGALRQRLFERGITVWPPVVAEIIRQIAQGLSFAHDRKIDDQPLSLVHCDISPDNVMIATSGTVKILDFGIARQSGAESGGPRPGSVQGRWGFMAPEQLDGAAVDQRTDVFSCGVVFHELLAGRPLFVATEWEAGIRLIKEMPIPRPSATNRLVSSALDDIVLRALERDPARRWPTTAALAEAIEELLAQDGWRSSQLTRILADLAHHSDLRNVAPAAPPALAAAPATTAQALSVLGEEHTWVDPLDEVEPLAAPNRATPASALPVPTAPPRSVPTVALLRHAVRSVVSTVRSNRRMRRVALAIPLLVLGWSSVRAAATRPAAPPPPPPAPTPAPLMPGALAPAPAPTLAIASVEAEPPTAPAPAAPTKTRPPAAQAAGVQMPGIPSGAALDRPGSGGRGYAADDPGHWRAATLVPRRHGHGNKPKASLMFDPFSD